MKPKVASYPNKSGKRMLRDLYYDRDSIDAETCYLALLLIGVEVSPNVIEQWSDEDRRHVMNYAAREYFRASDNAIERMAEPPVLKALKTRT